MAAGQSRWSRVLTSLFLVVLATLALTLALRLVLEQWFEVPQIAGYWHRDFLGNLALSLLCLALTASVGRTLILAGVLITGFQLANAGKLVVLGTPMSPDDFVNVRNLFLLWEGWKLWVMIAIVAIPALLLLALVRWRRVTTWLVLLALGGFAFASATYSGPLRLALDERFGNSVWNQPENFQLRGLALHLYQESVRTIDKVGKMPKAADIRPIVTDLPPAKADVTGLEPRNVHLILLETFFDPTSLGDEWVPDDPWDAAFRALWEESGNSIALSPVFGGYTANAEFEVLCGFPVTENAVFFEGWFRRRAACLPAVLKEAGYTTVASHPNVAGFWNRTQAYSLAGFDEYWSKNDFDMSDSAENFLLDHSYYEQAFDKLAELPEGPVLNYMVTIYGHLPYPATKDYPEVIEAGRDEGLLTGYLNHVYYKSRDLSAMLADLRKDDPDALIVLFGDHLPYLGPNYQIFDEFKSLPKDRNEFTGDMLDFLVSTPLVVIDGERGPLKLGKFPLYRLPSKILELLGASSGGILDWTENPPEETVRPVYGIHYAIDEAGNRVVCRPENAEDADCRQSSDWMTRTKQLSADIFSGDQFSLER